jgi:hypothetical protein
LGEERVREEGAGREVERGEEGREREGWMGVARRGELGVWRWSQEGREEVVIGLELKLTCQTEGICQLGSSRSSRAAVVSLTGEAGVFPR